MDDRQAEPTPEEMRELVAFLPQIRQLHDSELMRWRDTHVDDSCIGMPTPDYHPVVRAFFEVVSKECWSDRSYDPWVVGEMLGDPNAIEQADFDTLKSMLTYCTRGERFCDGHWASMIATGYVVRILERLACLAPG